MSGSSRAPAAHQGRDWAPVTFAAGSLLGLVALLVTGAAFALLLAFVEAEWRPLAEADQAVIDAANDLVSSSSAVETIAKVITDLGSPLGVTVAVVVPALFLLIRGVPRLAAFLAVSGLGAAVLGPGVKALVARARPVVEITLSSPTGASFPSGHSVAIAIVWGALLLVFLPVVPRRFRAWAIGAVVAVIVLVGLTRIALGVHFPSDVAAGWLLGGLWLTVATAAFRTARPAPAPIAAASPGVDALAPRERRELHPAPAHDRPLSEGGTTAAKLAVAGVLLCGAVIGVGLLVTGALGWVRRWDQRILEWFTTLDGGALVDVALAVGWLGGVSGIVTALAIALPLTAALTRRWTPPLFLLVTAAGQGLIYLASSRIVGRDRPGPERDDLLAAVSFPSGHVGAAVATYGALALLIVAFGRGRTRWGAPALAVLIIAGVAFSRLYHGVHFPSDVVAGAAYGCVWLVLCRAQLRPTREHGG